MNTVKDTMSTAPDQKTPRPEDSPAGQPDYKKQRQVVTFTEATDTQLSGEGEPRAAREETTSAKECSKLDTSETVLREGKFKKMTESFSESAYRPYNPSGDEAVGAIPLGALPPRYHTRTTNPDRQAERQARTQARAEARRTRRTMRLQQQQQQKQQQQQEEEHYKLNVEGDSSDDSSVDENYDVASITESIHESLTWRGRMQSVLHDHWFHLIIIFLVSLDALIVIFELLIDVGAFNNVECEGTNFVEQAERCHYENRDRCFPTAGMILENINISASPSESGSVSEICKCGFRDGKRVCVNREEKMGINPAIVLHILSLIILSTFLVEIVVKLIAFRLKYFTHKFEVFDGAVVLISFILDVGSIVEEEAFEAASLIIVLRLWRVVRIVNGAVLSSKAQTDRDLERIREEARKIVHALHKAQDRMDDLEAENLVLKRGQSGHNGKKHLSS